MVTQQTGFADINGAKIYYEVSGEGHPLLMVHAGIAHNAMWDEQVEFFAKNYKVVRFDMRGFGQSLPVPDDYQRHEDIRALLDFLGIEHTYLMGCSMGGGACMNFALEYPQRADALIMVGSGPAGFSYDEWTPSPIDEEMDTAYQNEDWERLNELSMQLFIDGTGRTPDQVNQALRKEVYDMNMIALNQSSLLGKEIPIETLAAERLGELDLPVLIVIGDLDEEYIMKASDFMMENIAGAQKIVMQGTAHLPNMEFPNEFNAHVQKFLANID